MQNLLVSIIIPCKDEKYNIDGLLKDIANQKITSETEIIKITNISPSGYARNIGAGKARGSILIFIDCDIRLGNEFVLSNLIKHLMENKNIDVVCASVRIPPDASQFQVRYAEEISHSQTPIVEELTEVFIPTVACLAISKETFLKIGMFNQDIMRGVDPEFAFRLKKAGHHAAIASNTWCYHSLPNNIAELMKVQMRDGLSVAFVDTFYPELNIDVHPKGVTYFSTRKTTLERAIRFSLTSVRAIFSASPILLLAKIFYTFGYLYGIFNYRILKYGIKDKKVTNQN